MQVWLLYNNDLSSIIESKLQVNAWWETVLQKQVEERLAETHDYYSLFCEMIYLDLYLKDWSSHV